LKTLFHFIFNSLFEVELPANITREEALKVAQSCRQQVVGSLVSMVLRQHDKNPYEALLIVAGKAAIPSLLPQAEVDGFTEGLTPWSYIYLIKLTV